MKRALITGITGQDGFYLADLLLRKKYKVRGLYRRTSTNSLERIEDLLQNPMLTLAKADLTDQGSLDREVEGFEPDEFYNLASQSYVPDSWRFPEATADMTALGCLRALEALRKHAPKCRFYQAGSSEMFGRVLETPQTEDTPFYPRSPYGVAKTFAHYTTVNYRESFGLWAVNGVCFNHTSPLRGEEFLERKVARAVAAIVNGQQDCLKLGNLDAKRDWGFAGDYVRAMWMMLQQDKPCDYVIATGRTVTVRELVEMMFTHTALRMEDYVKIDPGLVRPAEVDLLQGNANMIRLKVGWEPRTLLEDVVGLLISAEFARQNGTRAGLYPNYYVHA